MTNELISIIIPSYNRKDFICKAIESVLKQTYKNVEIIIVDDGSNDGTFETLHEKYDEIKNIKILKNERNSGAGFSRKVGYKEAKGAYIIFMDDDDYYTNFNFFDDAIKIFKKMQNVGMVSSSSVIEYVKENKFEDSIMNVNGLIKKSEYLSEFQQKYMKSNSTFTTIFRKSTLDNANFNDVDMVNDSSIYLRALIAGDAYVLNEISGVYRVHSKNITFSLNTTFIIQNLIEKKKVFEEIQKREILANPEEWLKKQVLLTTSYFVKYNNISDEDFEKLINWCCNNCGNVAKDVNKELKNIRNCNKESLK
ncbi:MAG: glycosyltransferase family 2 protein [Clostridia bacterium]|nr:glycosyltransferase family 2 protein [Clostridia bacterium]